MIEYYFAETIGDVRYDPDVYLFQHFAVVYNERGTPQILAAPLFRLLKSWGKPIVCDSDDDYVNIPKRPYAWSNFSSLITFLTHFIEQK